MEKKYKYLGYVLLVLFPLVFFAFYQTYFKNFPKFSSKIKLYDHIHVGISMLWISMLIIQPILIKNRQYAIHRLLGKASYVVFPLLILSFIPREIVLFHAEDKRYLFFPVADSLVLISLYMLAIFYKKNTAKHMRYFIASVLVFLGPTIGRIGYFWMEWPSLTTQNVQYSLIYLVLLLLIIYDNFKLNKIQPYLVAIALFLLHQIAYYMIFV